MKFENLAPDLKRGSGGFRLSLLISAPRGPRACRVTTSSHNPEEGEKEEFVQENNILDSLIIVIILFQMKSHSGCRIRSGSGGAAGSVFSLQCNETEVGKQLI